MIRLIEEEPKLRKRMVESPGSGAAYFGRTVGHDAWKALFKTLIKGGVDTYDTLSIFEGVLDGVNEGILEFLKSKGIMPDHRDALERVSVAFDDAYTEISKIKGRIRR